MRIGWAKPVPVNPNNFTERKKGMFLVSIAGPLTNMLLAVIAGRLAVFFYAMDLNYYLIMFLLLFTRLNLGYGIFNILPFPPLDGSKLFASLLPVKWEIFFYKYQKYFYFVLIILYFIGALDVILYPAITFLYELILS
ncbi:site-2 protease family protein [Candidatus Saccharibacteria bacterium]|nr:site-2 protease family protein [Candidatus Saccharibacteria bacterium]